ncbi:MAG: hypothetical protein ACKOFW_12150, partial [Planctomycetaceae bacterium]
VEEDHTCHVGELGTWVHNLSKEECLALVKRVADGDDSALPALRKGLAEKPELRKFVPDDVLRRVDGPTGCPIPGSYINSDFTIDMAGAPAGSATNAAGFARNGPWFWRKMVSHYPELFSPANRAAIAAGRSPIIDVTWIAGNPTHQSFMGRRLIHHHIEQGGVATGLPKPVHQAWHGVLHPER